MYHQAKFDLQIVSGFWVINKNVFANLCKPLGDVIIIPFYDFHFISEKEGEKKGEIRNVEYL